jgi:hypothetical protein
MFFQSLLSFLCLLHYILSPTLEIHPPVAVMSLCQHRHNTSLLITQTVYSRNDFPTRKNPSTLRSEIHHLQQLLPRQFFNFLPHNTSSPMTFNLWDTLYVNAMVSTHYVETENGGPTRDFLIWWQSMFTSRAGQGHSRW